MSGQDKLHDLNSILPLAKTYFNFSMLNSTAGLSFISTKERQTSRSDETIIPNTKAVSFLIIRPKITVKTTSIKIKLPLNLNSLLNSNFF